MTVKFTENDIRPDKFSQLQAEAIEYDINFLLQKKDNFVMVNCPACRTVNNETTLTKKGFKYTECKNCGMLYTNPRPSINILNEFYPNSPHYKLFNDYIFPSSIEVRREKMFKPRVKKVLEYCEKFNIKKDKIIEIGTGFGLFCEEIAKTKQFKDVVGVEASDSLAKTCKDMGFRIYNGLLEELTIDEKFNFAVAFEVLEHIFNPKSFLEIIHNLLTDDGFIMLTFPNYEGFDIDTLKEYSSSIDHEHLNYFTSKSITLLLNNIGFEVLEISTPGELDVDIVRKTVLKNNLKTSKFVKQVCLDNYDTIGTNFQEFLKNNKLSSHMLVIAKKGDSQNEIL